MTRLPRAATRPRHNRESEILEAAVEVFSRKGYAAASLQDVADAVGLLKGSLYHYISSKESLLFRIFNDSHANAEILMAEVDALGTPPEERLREFVRRLTIFYLQDPARASVYFSEWRHLTGQERKTVMAQRRAFEKYVRGIISEAQEQGLTREDLDPKLATFYLLAAINGVLIWYRREGPMTPEDIAAEIAELSCSSVLTRKGGRRTRTS